MSAPLEGLRVLELATGVAGPYAGRLLAMLGATVVKAEPPDGDPARRIPVDDSEPDDSLYVHLNAGKRNAAPDDVARAVDWAQVVIDDRVRGGREPAPPARRVWASVTAWGFEADEPGTVHDELLVQARSGVMAITGDPDGAPLRLPGWQSQYMAGGYAAAAAVAALADGRPHHVDVSWVGAIASGTESSFARALHAGRDTTPPGPHPRHVFPSGAIACADGHVIPGTVRPHDWRAQCELYGMPELARDERFKHRGARAQNRSELHETIRPFYEAHAKREIFERALDLGLALGMIVTPSDAVSDEHMASRGFLGDGGVALRPWVTDGLPAGTTHVAARGEDDAWFAEQLR